MKKTTRNTLAIIGLAGLAIGFALATKPAHAAYPFEGDKHFVDGTYDTVPSTGEVPICGTVDFFNVAPIGGGNYTFDYQLIWETDPLSSVVRTGTGQRIGAVVNLLDNPAGDLSIPFFIYTTDPLQSASKWNATLRERTGSPIDGEVVMNKIDDSHNGWDCSYIWE